MADAPGIAMTGICSDGALAGGIAIFGFGNCDGVGIAMPRDDDVALVEAFCGAASVAVAFFLVAGSFVMTGAAFAWGVS